MRTSPAPHNLPITLASAYGFSITALPLTFVSIALFSAKKCHRLFIFYILRGIYDGNNFTLCTNRLTGTDVLGDFCEVALRQIRISPDFNPNFVVRHRTSSLGGSLLRDFHSIPADAFWPFQRTHDTSESFALKTARGLKSN